MLDINEFIILNIDELYIFILNIFIIYLFIFSWIKYMYLLYNFYL